MNRIISTGVIEAKTSNDGEYCLLTCDFLCTRGIAETRYLCRAFSTFETLMMINGKPVRRHRCKQNEIKKPDSG
jgi:hypothetical protein